MQDIDVINDLPEPLKNETKNSPFGQAVLEGYQTDLMHLQGVRPPFYYNDEGFIMIKDPYSPHDKSQMYISNNEVTRGNYKINLRQDLIRSAHERLGHIGMDRI